MGREWWAKAVGETAFEEVKSAPESKMTELDLVKWRASLGSDNCWFWIDRRTSNHISTKTAVAKTTAKPESGNHLKIVFRWEVELLVITWRHLGCHTLEWWDSLMSASESWHLFELKKENRCHSNLGRCGGVVWIYVVQLGLFNSLPSVVQVVESHVLKCRLVFIADSLLTCVGDIPRLIQLLQSDQHVANRYPWSGSMVSQRKSLVQTFHRPKTDFHITVVQTLNSWHHLGRSVYCKHLHHF